MDEELAYLGFSYLKGIGPARFKLLKEYFKSVEVAFSASLTELIHVGLGEKLVSALVEFRNTFPFEKIQADLAKKQIVFIPQSSDKFPNQLLQIPDPPIGLFVKGNLPKNWSLALGVVGTRKPTSYGREITEKLTRELCQSGCMIISGFARGVDGIAHRTALAEGAITVAILGCGVDIVYPPEHNELYRRIIEAGGAIISEVPPGHLVSRGLFPARNRIISGLSCGVVVTEGAQDSGSLITAELAIEQNREVFAVPGPITSFLSAGPSKLIKQGAKVVTQVEDILEELGILGKPNVVKHKNSGASKVEQQVIDVLGTGALHFDQIVQASGLGTSIVGVIITQLELSGIIRSLGEGKYSLA